MEHFDIVVVGAGHAGCEAASIAARLGQKTLLLTINADLIAQLSCNPAIGGVAKGQLVKEIDALGGIMGIVTDRSAIQFRMLNKSKGTAVWSPRAQVDRLAYRSEMRALLDTTENLFIKQGIVKEILLDKQKVKGVKLYSGKEYFCYAVILCAGTFLNGIIHIGLQSFPAGRSGELPAQHLTEFLVGLGFESSRLKTGTPPRIDGRTIDFSKTIEQKGDEPYENFSARSPLEVKNQLPCYIAHTNEKTHAIIKSSLGESPLFTGKIKGVGPRYCPSIEDKLVRFADKTKHQLFLEPEGKITQEYYVNGFSTSIPEWAQLEALRSIEGLEHTEIIRPGYAIEYDFFPPTQLYPSLETRQISNLFFAGQINGTSGYEEAAAQGLLAGINAVQKIRNHPPLILRRDEAYIGVLIDDLVSKGTNEPYRLFTSRAEYRLFLRQDNADTRLSEHTFTLGLVDRKFMEHLENREKRVSALVSWLTHFSVDPENANPVLVSLGTTSIHQKTKASEILKRPEVKISDLKIMITNSWENIVQTEQEERMAESFIKYQGYFQRQTYEIEKQKKLDTAPIPTNLDYSSIDGLLVESRQKLSKIQPSTIGQAGRISGVTPADISVLINHLSRTGNH